MASNLAIRLASVAKQMQADFDASKQTRHSGSRGTEREEIVKHILELYLPGHVEIVHNAEIVSVSDEVSPQCDILIIDNKTPKLRDLKSHRIVPAECVYYVIEVKSNLTGPRLAESCEKIKFIRQMSRQAYIPDPSAHYVIGESSYPILPIGAAIFAFDSIRFESLGQRLAKWCDSNPPETHLDDIWVNNRGFFFWTKPDSLGGRLLNTADTPEREIRSIDVSGEGDVLLAMITRLSSWLTNARLPPVKLPEYLGRGKAFGASRRWPSGEVVRVGNTHPLLRMKSSEDSSTT